MESSLLEIIELDNGDVILRKADDNGEPLVNIRFSKEAMSLIPDIKMEIARAMFQAGIETFAEITSGTDWQVETENLENKVLH